MIDFNLSTDVFDGIILKDDLSCVLQQIDLLFNTEPYDVLGDFNYGTNYDKYLYTLGMSNISLENKILSDIKSLNLCGYTPKVNVTIVEGTVRDIAFIDITLYGDYDEYNKTYMIK